MPHRAQFVRDVFSSSGGVPDRIRAVWPSLALISCWTDGPSAVFANELRQLLPKIEFQAKGLLATEAFVSVPRTSQPASGLAVRSHFFEFQPASIRTVGDISARLLLADELESGKEYLVVVTTAGGLYRYQLHDQVAVVGFEGQVPLLRFVGKADSTCDLVGEKLNTAHLQSTLDRVFQQLQLRPTFAQLASVPCSPPRYVLRLAEPKLEKIPTLMDSLSTAIECELSTNPGYFYARSIGQLGPLTVERLSREQATTILREQIAERVAAGQRVGDVKPQVTMRCETRSNEM
jgi:hypothetical protein